MHPALPESSLEERLRQVSEHFWSKVQKGEADRCWPWMAGRSPRGYGRYAVTLGGKTAYGKSRVIHLRAARVVLYYKTDRWEETAMHSCDNPPCCNPGHLAWATQAVNRADCCAKGRQAQGETSGPFLAGKLTVSQVAEIYDRYIPWVNSKILGEEFGVSPDVINHIGSGRGYLVGAAPRVSKVPKADPRTMRHSRVRGERHLSAKLTQEQVDKIRELASTATGLELAAQFGVHSSTIYKIIKREIWNPPEVIL